MADELAYGSNKRKYEESPPPVRRASGFSSPPSDAAPYKAAPPPQMDEIELAKRKAQEIAARLLNTADPSKKARVDNGGGGFDSSEASYGYGQKPLGLGPSGMPHGGDYGYPSQTKRIEIPNGRVGVIIGKGGETIKYLQMQSGAKIQVTRDMDADPNSATRDVELTGTPDQIAKAEQLVNDVLAEADAGGTGNRRGTGQLSGSEQFVMKVANNKVGLVIGKGGETIRNIQASTGARVQVIPLRLPPGDTSKERTVQIDGTFEQIEAAKQMIYEVTSENRMRNPSMSGGYQPRPPANWAPPMQQSGYGYTQPGGGYTGPSPQYNMNQPPPYGGYPPPQPASGWGQSTGPQSQQASQGGGYDYYNQQQPTHAGSGDVSNYGYDQGQATSYSHYGPDGYGGAQGDANQAPPTAGESQKAGGQASPNPNYPPQGFTTHPSSQGGYGATTQQPPSSYGAPTQKSNDQSAAAAYGQQGGYSYYSQPPPPPPQGGYYGYGMPPPYGQQQQPPPYNGGYAQPTSYASDGSAAAPQQVSQQPSEAAPKPSADDKS